MSELKRIQTQDAPAAIGPYSQAISAGDLVFTAGQIALNPVTMTIDAADITGQTEQVMKNLRAILEAAGASMSSVIKTTVFLLDMEEFAAMNAVYATHFGDHKPARSTVQAVRLPRDVRVEIEAIARIS
jgi:2-iminobutanoate/2-iminopropanoate deaminase